MYNEFGDLAGSDNYDKSKEALLRFIDLDIPCAVVIDETRYMPIGEQRGYERKIAEWNEELSALGVYTTAYINPNLDVSYRPLYEEVAESDLLVRRVDGSIYTYYYSGANA